MLFNSIEFFVFFAIVYALYRLLPEVRIQNRMLLLASYVFYGWWDVRFLYLVVLSTGVDFCAGLILGPGRIPRSDRLAVSLGVVLAAGLFVGPRWSALLPGTPLAGSSLVPGMGEFGTSAVPLGNRIGWLFTPDRFGCAVFLGTIAAVLVANLVYFPLVRLPDSQRRRAGLLLTVVSNLLFLGSFKYFNFFIDSADRLLAGFGLSSWDWRLHIILPVGISFYTFQSLSYTIDVYYGRTGAVRRLEDYALFVMFFPVLVAGPIERAGHLVPKLTRPRVLTVDQTTRGLFLILFGLVKKVTIADGLAPSVNSVYNSTGNSTWADVVLATLAFAFQIYCDFSGYTDIVRGVGKVLGFDLLHNFNLPYFSHSPREFWQRWHISLSSWLRDYLYIPLGGNERGAGRTYRNLMITMVLGGLWHGASWNFVFWGFYHGAVLCVYRLLTPRRRESGLPTHPGPLREEHPRARSLARAASLAFFFLLTCYGWLLFRASTLGQIASFTATLFTDFGDMTTAIRRPPIATSLSLVVLIVYEFLQHFAGSHTFYRAWPRPVRGAFYAILVFILIMGLSNAPAQFIYFQF